MANRYYPQTNDGRAEWWANIISDNGTTLAACGIPAAQITSILADAAMAVYLYRTLPNIYAGFVMSITGYIHAYLDGAIDGAAPVFPAMPTLPTSPDAVLGGIEARREKWVQAVKSSTSYNPEVQGNTLRTEGTGSGFDPASYVAVVSGVTCTATATVSAKFRKAGGNVAAMEFHGRKAGTGTWINLGRFMATPASLHIPITTPGQPEEWEIQGQACAKDTPVGQPSGIQTVLVRG